MVVGPQERGSGLLLLQQILDVPGPERRQLAGGRQAHRAPNHGRSAARRIRRAPARLQQRRQPGPVPFPQRSPSRGGRRRLPDPGNLRCNQRPQPGGPGPAGNGKVPDHHQYDRRSHRTGPDRALRLGEDGGLGGGQAPAGQRGSGGRLFGASQQQDREESRPGRTQEDAGPGPAQARAYRARPRRPGTAKATPERLLRRRKRAPGRERGQPLPGLRGAALASAGQPGHAPAQAGPSGHAIVDRPGFQA